VAISRVKTAVGRLLMPHAIPTEQYLLQTPRVLRAWLEIGERSLTYSRPRQLTRLLSYVRRFERQGVEGEIIEAGCAWGGSAILMCSAKRPSRPMRVFDVFGMIPPPSENDGTDMHQRYAEIVAGASAGLGGQGYYAYDHDLKSKVERNFADLGYPIESNAVSLIAGKVQDTLTVDGPVCLAHIDVDWYEPVMACLERIVPFLVPGGAVALRAYSDWSGCRKAADEYLKRSGIPPLKRKIVAGQLFLERA
jgi:O-methyltransferase